jgi:hypothetical protein
MYLADSHTPAKTASEIAHRSKPLFRMGYEVIFGMTVFGLDCMKTLNSLGFKRVSTIRKIEMIACSLFCRVRCH